MTEAALQDAPAPGSDMLIDEGEGYSKDYWDLVFEQLARRKLFKAGLAVLALLYSTAAFAPMLANDRPYYLEAIDYGSYKDATRSLGAVGVVAERELRAPPASRRTPAEDDPSPASLDPIADQRRAAGERIRTLQSYLPTELHPPLDEFLALFDRAIAARAAGDSETAGELATELKSRARSIRSEYDPREPDEEEGVELVPARSWPLFQSISSWEVAFMVLSLLVLTWPVWNRLVNRVLLRGDRERIRSARTRKVAFALVTAISGGLVWAWTVGGERDVFATARYKADLTDGDIVAVGRAIFPPLAFGYAETHAEEGFRPPTWTEKARLDEEGRYVHPSRRPAPDPVTGYLPPATPVEVRAGEPDVNSPWRHPAGTDELGRDFLVRMIWGGRVSLAVGILSALLLTIIGILVGASAGYFGGKIDIAIMRVIEVVQSIPAFFLILLVMAFTDPNVVPPIIAIVVVIAMIRWTSAARLVRGEFLRLREQEFVIGARALGFSSQRTIFRHILPNAMSPVLVNAAFAVAAGILTESAISFLGFGIQHPGASWGSLVNESKSAAHWWVQFFPGLLIFITVTCYNLVGDAVRDALDPKMKV